MQTPGELSDSSLSPADAQGRLDAPHRSSQLIDFTRVSGVLKPFLKSRATLRLRTKLLLSLVSIIALLTFATLLVVRHSAQIQVQRQIEQDARNALLTIQAVQHQREMLLSRKADLLATLAYMRNGDATTIQDASQDTWQSDDCDLFALADRKGKIIALHTAISTVSAATAGKLLHRSLQDDSRAGWWFGDSHFFQVVLQPYYQDESHQSRLLGTVIVGCEMDVKRASDLGRISSSHLVFRNGDDVVMSTFSLSEEQELVPQLQDRPDVKRYKLAKSGSMTIGDFYDCGLMQFHIAVCGGNRKAAAWRLWAEIQAKPVERLPIGEGC